MTRVFAVSGYSMTGKTTLIESIIQELKRRGYSVASVKSSGHAPTEETGSDTWKHRQAGAELTVFLGSTDEEDRRTRVERIKSALGEREFDFLVVEGMKNSKIPKVWCLTDMSALEDSVPPETRMIVLRDNVNLEPHRGIPVVHPENLQSIVDMVIESAADLDGLDES
ncbi:MAG: molybdopterin-guanine dinucleotide biosynthesis protein B [Candidatus Thorarchaeota archaeon]